MKKYLALLLALALVLGMLAGCTAPAGSQDNAPAPEQAAENALQSLNLYLSE